jgi:hypothetical protein
LGVEHLLGLNIVRARAVLFGAKFVFSVRGNEKQATAATGKLQ